MKAYEPECVAMKRRGAKYVSQLLSGKSKAEQLDFWLKRTEVLLSKQKKKNKLKSQQISA